MGTQTKPEFVEKTIIPTKFKNKQNKVEKREKQKPVEIITEGVDFESVEDILQHLGKNLNSSGNLMFVVKLIGALMSKLSNQTVNETELTQLLTLGKKKGNHP